MVVMDSTFKLIILLLLIVRLLRLNRYWVKWIRMNFTSISILLFSVCLMSCSNSIPNENLGIVVFENEDVLIELTGIEDSRCPLDVTCVWEGDAVVQMSISSDGYTSIFTLNSNPNVDSGQVRTEQFGYSIKLNDVSPYPETSGQIDLDEYEISLEVRKI